MSERERYWRGVLEQWRVSGLSRAAFCRQHAISYHSLSQWKSRIKADANVGPGGRRRRFVEIAAPLPAAPSYEIALAGGRSLRVPPGFDDGEVARLIAVVEPC